MSCSGELEDTDRDLFDPSEVDTLVDPLAGRIRQPRRADRVVERIARGTGTRATVPAPVPPPVVPRGARPRGKRRWLRSFRTGALLALVALSACAVAAEYSDTEFSCPDGSCPDGFECVQSQCVPPGTRTPDAGHADAQPAPPSDAQRPVVDAQPPFDAQPPADAADDLVAAGLRGTYYDGLEFTGESLTRIDSVVDFIWERESPDPAIDVDTFSIRWSGFVRPRYSETYTLYLVSDDGVRLSVGGALLIDDWTDHTEREDSAILVLEAGIDYPLELEYYDNERDATVRLLWSSPSQPKEVIPADRLTHLRD